ncbi:T9SS type A sorting domain-containing protein [Winogradskyella thalassocola]|uniref:Por secretion system C-terminal sorting domain-containing protein n=1 Tax=Winogradskyella thalassocola TaxID=262004 RepID=A0A1G8E608_9FLAO|nr:T9SS type A sorting domain-containing protein [Winogradskyella thalassocola]SDH65378.1 Por secretion system C-terminal sorting domain-containing protein [Winogradskyella thalassocola]
MKLKLLFVFLFACSFSFAQQIPENIKPPSWSQNNISDLMPFKLPSFDLKKLQDEDVINDQNKSKPWRFGHDIYVDHNFNDVGEWTTLENGDRIWRMAYTSDGAYSLNFMFDVFKIPEGAQLYVYNKEKTDLLRPFTYHNNNEEEVLGTWLVEGNTAYIEYYQPVNVLGEAKITVGSVVHGYRTAETYQKALNDSGSCNFDVDCDITPTTDPYGLNTVKENIKTSGALILRAGTDWCSGTLINNTNNDGTPYLLTANHCGGGESTWSFRFNWRSPNPSCGTSINSTNGTYNQTVSGATVRASSSKSDMELVEITDPSFFENNNDLVWAGWNRSITQVPAVSFGFHHPSGDIQKVSRNDEGGYRFTTTFNGNSSAQMWRIDDWELGVTEGGSSGSGLFNETGHLIGMLSGGSAACSGTNDNGGFDIYGRFGVAWDFGGSASSQLKDWLDPSDSGIEILDQYPPLQTYDNDAKVSAGTNSSDLCGADFAPEVTLINSGNLQLTSANISYYIDSETPTTIAWTGSLANGASAVLETPNYSNLITGDHTFTINVTNPNGTTDENMSNDSYVFNFTVIPSYVTSEVVFNITTDEYGYETSWELTNSSGTLINSGPLFDFQSETDIQVIIPIPAYDGCYTFTIFDSADDGICCGYGNGSYTLEDENGNEIISGANFEASESVTFNPQNPLSVNEFSIEQLIRFYPNPVNDNLNIDLSNLNEGVNFEIFNTLGKQINKGNLKSNETHILNISQYQSGIYFVKLSTSTSSITKKIIKK